MRLAKRTNTLEPFQRVPNRDRNRLRPLGAQCSPIGNSTDCGTIKHLAGAARQIIPPSAFHLI